MERLSWLPLFAPWILHVPRYRDCSGERNEDLNRARQQFQKAAIKFIRKAISTVS